MTPGQASKGGKILAIDHPEGGIRTAAHVFDIEGGIAYVEPGWTELVITNQPAHVIEGDFVEFSLGWAYTRPDGEDIFIEIDPDGRAQEGTRAQAKAALEEIFGIKIPE